MQAPVQLQAEDGEAGTELKALLKATAEVYRTLLSNAHKAGIAVPPEALLKGREATDKGAPRWNDFAALEAEDWEDFEDEGGAPGHTFNNILAEHQLIKLMRSLALLSIPTDEVSPQADGPSSGRILMMLSHA